MWQKARDDGYVIVTRDADFQELSLVWGQPPKVIRLKTLNQSRVATLKVLIENRDAIADALVANEFNLRCWGKSMTGTSARNWFLGKSIPTQDKLRVLADWLHVSSDELHCGTVVPVLTTQDHDTLGRYMKLPLEVCKAVGNVLVALASAVAAGARLGSEEA